MTKTNKLSKTETVEEFLARGGKIQKLEYVEREERDINVKPSNAGPVNMMSKGSSSFASHLSKEDFDELLARVDKMSKEEKQELADMLTDTAELSMQSPSLEEAAVMYGEKTERKKKDKILDKDEIKHLSSFLSEKDRKDLDL